MNVDILSKESVAMLDRSVLGPWHRLTCTAIGNTLCQISCFLIQSLVDRLPLNGFSPKSDQNLTSSYHKENLREDDFSVSDTGTQKKGASLILQGL